MSKKFAHSGGGIGARGEVFEALVEGSAYWVEGGQKEHLISRARAKPRCLLLQDKTWSQGGVDDDHLIISTPKFVVTHLLALIK